MNSLGRKVNIRPQMRKKNSKKSICLLRKSMNKLVFSRYDFQVIVNDHIISRDCKKMYVDILQLKAYSRWWERSRTLHRGLLGKSRLKCQKYYLKLFSLFDLETSLICKQANFFLPKYWKCFTTRENSNTLSECNFGFVSAGLCLNPGRIDFSLKNWAGLDSLRFFLLIHMC